MKKYDSDDIVTFYFVIYQDNVKAWTDDKDLAEAYMSFHSCKKYTLKKMRDRWTKIVYILNENANDEIQINFMETRDPSKKNTTKLVAVPLTQTEAAFVHDEIQTFMATSVNYTFLSSAIPYLKKRYQNALSGIFLSEVIKYTLTGGQAGDLDILAEIQMDQVKVLYRNFPDQF